MTTTEQPITPVEGVCESCDSLAIIAPVTDEGGQTFLVCPACI